MLEAARCDSISASHETQRIWRRASTRAVRILLCPQECTFRYLRRPFLLDLESANGSTVNGEDIPTSRYYELRTGDTCQFGTSKREYVLLDESVAP